MGREGRRASHLLPSHSLTLCPVYTHPYICHFRSQHPSTRLIHLSLASLAFSSTSSHGVLIPDPVHPRSSWGEPRSFRLSSSTLSFMISWSSCPDPVVFLVAFKCPMLVFWQARCTSCRPVVCKV